MGLTIKRLAFCAVVLAAVLLPLRPRATTPVATVTNPTWELYRTLAAARAATVAWSALAAGDTAERLIAAGSVTSGVPDVVFLGRPAGTSDSKATRMLTSLWQRIGVTDPDVHTIVLTYTDSAFKADAYVGAYITHRGAETDCVAMGPSYRLSDGTVRVADAVLSEAIAPCVLWAAFGHPGAAVERWLDATRYAAAQSNGWATGGPLSRYPAGPWVGWQGDFSTTENEMRVLAFADEIGLAQPVVGLTPPYLYGATGLRCLTGDTNACAIGVLHPDIKVASAIPAGFTAWAPGASPDSITVGTVRPPEPFMIAALIRDQGRERFRRFWTSDQPVESAFESAFGQSLGAWTARWAQQQWLMTFHAQQINSDILLGVTFRPPWLPLVALWTGLSLLIATRVAARRTG